jgi:hypothetical protein
MSLNRLRAIIFLMVDIEHLLKGHQVAIADMIDKIPPVFKKMGLESIRASQEYYLEEMDRASEECDALRFAVAFGNERHFDSRLDTVLVDNDLATRLPEADAMAVLKDAEENVRRVSGLLDKWKTNCHCNRKGTQPSNYRFAVKRMSDYMDDHGRDEKGKIKFSGWDASLVLAYLYDVEKEKALTDIGEYRLGKMKQKK